MTARLAADGRPVSPEDIRALIQRGQDRPAEVQQARTQRADMRPVVAVAAVIVIALAALGFAEVLQQVIWHWRGTVKTICVSTAAGYLFHVTRRSQR